jgi:uncharacterized protein (TIGR03546 family)
MNPLRVIKDLLQALHGGTEPRHLAAGFALGAALGLIPKGNLFAVSFFLLFFLFNVDKGMAFLSAALFTAFGYGLDSVAHKVGLLLLKAEALRGLWTALYDLPIVPLTRFNNTVVLGNLVLGVLLYFPLYFGFLKGHKLYDLHLRARVEALPIIKSLRRWDKLQKYKAKYERWLA